MNTKAVGDKVMALFGFIVFIVVLTLILKNPKSTNAVLAAGVGTGVGVAKDLIGPSKGGPQ